MTTAEESSQQRSIKDIASKTDSAEHTTPFSKENTQVIKEMIGTFGKSEDEVVLTAVTLLYMISQRTKNVISITITSKDKENFTFAMPSFEK